MQLRLVLEGQRGQVRVRRQIPCRANRFEQTEQELGMAIAWVNDAHVRLSQPRPDVRARGGGRQRVQQYLGSLHETDYKARFCLSGCFS